MTNDHEEALSVELKRLNALISTDDQDRLRDCIDDDAEVAAFSLFLRHWLVERSGHPVMVNVTANPASVAVHHLQARGSVEGTGPYAELLATLIVVNDWLESFRR